MSSTYSPSRNSPGASSRLQQYAVVSGISRLRSSSLKKPPEPLRRAIADCLSSSSASLSSHHANPTSAATDASRTLRDYLAASTTTDLAYCVILEHTIAERERSPAVVARCVALLKRYLLRYKPSEETLHQIDRFCVSIIAECDISPKQRSSPWSRSLNQQSAATTVSANAFPSLPASTFASGALVKSLNYVRSLVAQHIPKRSFQAAAFAGAPTASRHSLPTLSSFLSRSFNSQLKPASGESSESKDVTALPVSKLSNVEHINSMEDVDFIAVDVFKWRWVGELSTESDRSVDLQDVSSCNFLELGAASLLVGDMEAKMKGQPWKYFGTADMPFIDQLFQRSSVTTITNSSSGCTHLRAITASKRSKAGPHQIWEDSPVSTFRPRARPLFQYRHYSEQQPLRLNPAEVCEVIAAVSSEIYSQSANHLTVSSKLTNNGGKPSMDVAVSVLIKLVIDMYVLDSGTAAPLTLSMLQEMLSSPKAACRVRAFDLILNLGVHAHLLEPVMSDDTSTIEEEYLPETFFDCEEQLAPQGKRKTDSVNMLSTSSAINKFESWILNILYEILLLLVQLNIPPVVQDLLDMLKPMNSKLELMTMTLYANENLVFDCVKKQKLFPTEEKEESVWASALSCLLYFVCDRGKILRSRLEGLDIRVIKVLIEISRNNSWAELVHSKLICMLTNMFYQVPGASSMSVSKNLVFLVNQIDLIGGIEFIFIEYSLANLRNEKRNLYSVLFDYALHQINEACIAAGVSEYSEDEIKPVANLLILAGAPEALYISVKLGLEGIVELLRRSISAALSRFSNSERLNMLLESLAEKFDTIISSFTHIDQEFSHLIQITKSYKFLESIENVIQRNGVGIKAKQSWATLHSLLHSERISYRRNGYTWLGDLLIAEISGGNIWSNITELPHKIAHAGANDLSATSDVPLSVWLLCGLLKSKHSFIRSGFLFVVERLLMRCKFLLDENEMQQSSSSKANVEQLDGRLEKANAVIDVMSSALSLLANERDHLNILKMCDILFSQLCLKVLPGAAMPHGESIHHARVLDGRAASKKHDAGDQVPQQEKHHWNEVVEESDSRSSCGINSSVVFETASVVAMLLRGQAIVPTKLVARVPASLFYWPLLQLAGAATDNIALGVAVGSKGRGNLPGTASDIRATLLLLLIGKCTGDPSAFEDVGGEEFFRGLLEDTDSRVAYYSSAFLLKRMMTQKPYEYKRMLQNLVFKAQQSNNEKLLENPYLQIRGILQLSTDGIN